MKFLLFYITFVFTLYNASNAQNIANYIGNGSFEQNALNCTSNELKVAKYWNSIDSITYTPGLFSYCNGNVPNQGNTTYQLPRTGNVFSGSTFYYGNANPGRQYLKNRLKFSLRKDETYCVKFFVNIMNTSTLGSDGFGIYFGDALLDTITKIHKPLNFLTPQIESPNHVHLIDTLGWTAVTGTFVATGKEKYAVIGMFKANGQLDTVIVNPTNLPLIFVDACIDDVSCIPIDLPAYAGPDVSCVVGHSVFIGRTPDVEIDESCRWYKLPITITPTTPALDTAAGIWVSPTQTSTYVVRQQLWCSGVKYDTVVVYQDFVGLVSSSVVENIYNIYPNPTSNKLNFSYNKNLKSTFDLSITNLLGQILFTQNNFKLEDEIDLSFLPKGIYYLNIENDIGQKVFKVVKE